MSVSDTDDIVMDEREKFKVEAPASVKSSTAVVTVAAVGSIEAYGGDGECFVSYRDRVEQFFLINHVEDKLKTAYFISIAGAEVYRTLKS